MVLCGQGFPLLVTVMRWWESKSIPQTGSLKQYGSFCKTTMKPQLLQEINVLTEEGAGRAVLCISWLKGLTWGPQRKTQGREAGSPMTGSVGSCTGPASPPVSIALSHYIPTAAHPSHGTGWRTGLTRSSPCPIYVPGTAWWAGGREGSGKWGDDALIRVLILSEQFVFTGWFNVYYQTKRRLDLNFFFWSGFYLTRAYCGNAEYWVFFHMLFHWSFEITV